jgi:hypothetical protein
VHLIADSIRCGPETGRIPVLSGVISRPFFGLKSRTRSNCLREIQTSINNQPKI